jgi:hypothetical protein
MADRITRERWDRDLEVFVEEDVTKEWQALEKARDERDQLQKDISELRTRRGWDEISTVYDEKTGRQVIVRTYYQWEAKTMRLEVSPEMMYGVGYGR